MPELRRIPNLALFCLLPVLGSASASAASYIASEGGQTGTTLSGTITQTDNGQPLSGALVVIDELRKEVHAALTAVIGSRTCRRGSITSASAPRVTARGAPRSRSVRQPVTLDI
jgi:hypothetical protein